MHHKRKDLSRIQIIEFSILFIILNYLDIASKKLEELSEIEFLAENNEGLKKETFEFLKKRNFYIKKEKIYLKFKLLNFLFYR